MQDLSKYNSILDQALRDFITERDHIDTGAMYASVRFDISSQQNTFNITLEAEHYIEYLDNYQFLNDFYELSSTQLILDDIAEDFTDNLLEKLTIK